MLESHHLQPGPHPLKTAARTTEEVLFLGLESNDPGNGQARSSAPGFPALPHLGTVVFGVVIKKLIQRRKLCRDSPRDSPAPQFEL